VHRRYRARNNEEGKQAAKSWDIIVRLGLGEEGIQGKRGGSGTFPKTNQGGEGKKEGSIFSRISFVWPHV